MMAERIRNDVTEGMDKQQREFLLRQQMAAIRKELGEGDDDALDDYRRRRPTLPVARERARASRTRDRPARAQQRPEPRAELDPHLARPRARAAVGQARQTTASTWPRRRAVLDADHTASTT